MTHVETVFDTLLATAHELAITAVTGQLGPPIAGRMWFGSHSLDGILCPDLAERQVAILIVPGGLSETSIHLGRRTIDAAELSRLAAQSAAVGGSLTQGWLAVLTPSLWLERHGHTPASGDATSTLAMALAAGWPASCGDDPALFLGDVSLYELLAQANVGRAVTLLVATLATPPQLAGQQVAGAPAVPSMQLKPAPAGIAPQPSAGGRALADAPIRVVQQDAWERPRSPHAPQPTQREPAVGDRVIIRQGRRALPALVGKIGTVVEIFRVPRDSCLVRIDHAGDREWFCYHDEVALYTV